MSWNLCLSIGGSTSTITAISKGQSIGAIAPPDQSKDDAGSKKGEKKGDDTIQVMGFTMTIQDDSIMVKGKPKTTRESDLVRKYSSEEVCKKVKDMMIHAERSEMKAGRFQNDLDAKASHMY